MPTIIDVEGATRDVSLEEYQRLVRPAVAAEGVPNVMKMVSDGAPRIRLWDMVDGTQTGFLDPVMAHHQYLRYVIEKCSVCSFTTMGMGQSIASHVKATRVTWESHQGAQVLQQIVPDASGMARSAMLCTGCGASFSRGIAQAQEHLRRAQESWPEHERLGVEQITMRRFALERTTSVVFKREPLLLAKVVASSADDTGQPKVALPEDVVRRKRKRHRSRHRHGEKA